MNPEDYKSYAERSYEDAEDILEIMEAVGELAEIHRNAMKHSEVWSARSPEALTLIRALVVDLEERK